MTFDLFTSYSQVINTYSQVINTYSQLIHNLFTSYQHLFTTVIYNNFNISFRISQFAFTLIVFFCKKTLSA